MLRIWRLKVYIGGVYKRYVGICRVMEGYIAMFKVWGLGFWKPSLAYWIESSGFEAEGSGPWNYPNALFGAGASLRKRLISVTR